MLLNEEYLKHLDFLNSQVKELIIDLNLLKLKTSQRELEKKLNKSKCIICLDTIVENFVELSCNHSFHFQCLVQMTVTSEPYNKCPLCRKEFPVPNISQTINDKNKEITDLNNLNDECFFEIRHLRSLCNEYLNQEHRLVSEMVAPRHSPPTEESLRKRRGIVEIPRLRIPPRLSSRAVTPRTAQIVRTPRTVRTRRRRNTRRHSQPSTLHRPGWRI